MNLVQICHIILIEYYEIPRKQIIDFNNVNGTTFLINLCQTKNKNAFS